MALKKFILPLIFLGMVFFGGACAQEQEPALLVPPPIPDQEEAGQLEEAPDPPRALSICLGEEPRSLFYYGDSSLSARIIRQAIYDLPVSEGDDRSRLPLLEQLPSLENGLVATRAVTLQPGERMIDLYDSWTVLAEGIEYLPSGCYSADCAVTYSGEGEVTLDKVVVRFPLRDDLTWADGAPLTAEDSAFSFQMARELFSFPPPKPVRLTSSYEAVDEYTVEWTGIPGFLGLVDYSDFFFPPFPSHRWGELAPEALLTSESSTQKPLGWGAYQVEEWIEGDHLSLSTNPNYQGEDPVFDGLVFRFVSDVEEGLDAFNAGECEILLNVDGLEEALKESGGEPLAVEAGQSTYSSYVWDQISFGIGSLDPARTILSERKVREAISYCIDREGLAAQTPQVVKIASSFYPPGDPRFSAPGEKITYRPDRGAALLEEAGWMDHDQDPETPRQARGVPGIRDGSALELTLLLAGEGEIPPEGALIQETLAGCGVDLQVTTLPAAELLAPGPEGPIFGRRFDLAKFSWTTKGYQPCKLFLSSEIPGGYPFFYKAWGGTNAPGFSDAGFDGACQEILHNLPDQDGMLEAHQAVQSLLREELPVLPLFFRERLILFRADLEGLDQQGSTPLWNIEQIHD